MLNIYLFRHGQTEWALNGKHTGLTDIPLTKKGEKDAALLGQRISSISFSKVYTSPLQRAYKTCEIAGLSKDCIVSPLLLEWNYGQYEGLTTKEIQQKEAAWTVFDKGAPGGESISDIEKRTKAFLLEIKNLEGNIAVFSSGHFLRALASQWTLGSIKMGKHLILEPGSLSILGFEHDYHAILKWNDTSHCYA